MEELAKEKGDAEEGEAGADSAKPSSKKGKSKKEADSGDAEAEKEGEEAADSKPGLAGLIPELDPGAAKKQGAA